MHPLSLLELISSYLQGFAGWFTNYELFLMILPYCYGVHFPILFCRTLRPYPISIKRTVPAHIDQPDWAVDVSLLN